MFINKSSLKTIIITLLFVIALFGGVYIIAMALDTIHLNVTVVKDGKTVLGVHVYVFAIAPNGTRFVKSAVTNQYGVASFELSIKDIIKPVMDWNKAEKRSFTINPGLYITTLGKHNNTLYFGAGSIKLPLTLTGPIFTSTTINLQHKITKTQQKIKTSTMDMKQQAPPWAKLIYSEQKTMRETFFKVITDQNTKASCGYLAEYNKEVAFKCTFSVTLKSDNSIEVPWSIGAEISWVTSQTEKALTFDVDQNSIGYVSCLVALNYECWEYEEPADGGELYLEHRIYAQYYYPDSLQTTKGEDDIDGNQIFLKSTVGKGWNEVATIVYLYSQVSQEFAIPIITFILGIQFSKLPATLRVPIDIDLVIKEAYSISADVRVYGVEGVTINIYYIKVYRTVNAYYELPAWAIILKT
ncbi:MAG: hypothetical protein QXE58_01575 [Candidatus Methanomethylicia archaeon]